MTGQLMGVETEYAFSGVGAQGEPLAPGEFLHRFLDAARKRHPFVPDPSHAGMFLANGSRLYVDCGLHPELSTPEVTNPTDAVLYVKAGDSIVRGIADEIPRADPAVREVLVFRGNLDYASLSTWGCHESYLHRVPHDERLAHQLLPHLVSRIVYGGAGAFDPHSPGLRFTLSARAPFLKQAVSCSSTVNRGIFHTKNEPLCGHGYRRLHLLCGDSLSSETSLWLTLGATALVIALVDAGVDPGGAVALRDPVGALDRFASDPGCRAEAGLAAGGSATASSIQRHYLEQVEARAGETFMPPWAPDVCRVWRETLDRLERDPEDLCLTLDWAIKHRLYLDRAGRRGFPWEQVSRWTSVLGGAREGIPWLGTGRIPPNLLPAEEPVSPSPAERARIAREAREAGLPPEDLDAFLSLRRELHEIDTRFAQLGEAGIFRALDRSGALDHRRTDAGRIEAAVSEPPPGGRAELRGHAIREAARNPLHHVCSWDTLWDRKGQRILDLSDPFETQEKWRSWKPPAPPRSCRSELLRLLVELGL